MQLLEYTQQRLRSFIAEIDRLSKVDFPYAHSKAALLDLKQYFGNRASALNHLDVSSDPAIVRQHCTLVLRDFFHYLPLLGFVLRSTNVRNAFETFRPLLRMARQVLEPDVDEGAQSTKLLISSEWDYSPLTYPTIPNLPGFVFIGFPAPESGNPLVVPLAGHELGHAVWIRELLANKYRPLISASVVQAVQRRWDVYAEIFHPDFPKDKIAEDLFAVETWEPSVEWGVRQAEESFCDFLGLSLFRESFLHAFAYLLSPGLGIGYRAVHYPPLHLRAGRLHSAAQAAGIAVQDDYATFFEEETIPDLSRADQFRVEVADEALETVVPQLQKDAEQIVKKAGLLVSSDAERDRILARFKRAVPAEDCANITALMNAGWTVFLDKIFWPSDLVAVDRRDDVLRELVLKNFEIYEIEHIQGSEKS